MTFAFTYRSEHSEVKTTNGDYGQFFQSSIKVKIQPTLVPLLRWVDKNCSALEQNLSDMIAIPSISGSKRNYDDMIRMNKMVQCWLRKLGIRYDTFNVGTYKIGEEKLNIPPVIIATLGNDKNKPTIGVYGHTDIKYSNEGDWDSKCPYKLTIENDYYFGAGTASGKGPLLMWFHAIQAFQDCHTDIPVNIVFVIDPMFEQNHQGLEQLLKVQRTGLLRNIDHWMVCEKTWIGKLVPCISYGTIGFVHFQLSSEKCEGSNTNPRDDLETIGKSMINENGEILIDGFNRMIQPLTPDAEVPYDNIRDFDFESIRNQLPPYKQSWRQKKFLLSLWSLPELHVTPIEECTCDKKDTMPEKVRCLLLFKIVPHQIPEMVIQQVMEHLHKVITEKDIGNKIECQVIHNARPWIVNRNCIPIEAAKRAIIQIYKVVPNLIREDESLEILLILNRVFKNEILLLPIASSDSNPRKPNENISRLCFLEGTKVICAYLFQFAQLQKSTKSQVLTLDHYNC